MDIYFGPQFEAWRNADLRKMANDPMIDDLAECPACNGVGSYTIGDIEDGVEDICHMCDGAGTVEFDPANTDFFVPERDAFEIGD